VACRAALGAVYPGGLCGAGGGPCGELALPGGPQAAELFFPVSGVLYKTPEQTWSQYAPIFRRHATTTVTPELLAALAQVEGAGNPVARTTGAGG